MTKSDLRIGMKVIIRTGEVCRFDGEYIIYESCGTKLTRLSDYSSSLLMLAESFNEYDVMSLLWERVETEEMTLEQVCEALGKDIKIVKGE